jgi:Sulfotransferase family
MIKEINKKIKTILLSAFNFREEAKVKRIISNSERSIYHIHIRKTAGTTINYAFLNNSNQNDVETFYENLAIKYNHRLIGGDKVFVGWNKKIINSERYSYAFSHIPLHQLKFSKNIFLFTCLRDPVKRVVSHYNMLMHFRIKNIKHKCMKTEGKWLGHSFINFINNIPKEHLLNQLYTFSETFDVDEAVNRISTLNMVLFTDHLEEGLKELGARINWNLTISNQKSYGHKEFINHNEMDILKKVLKEEIRMYNIVKDKIDY